MRGISGRWTNILALHWTSFAFIIWIWTVRQHSPNADMRSYYRFSRFSWLYVWYMTISIYTKQIYIRIAIYSVIEQNDIAVDQLLTLYMVSMNRWTFGALGLCWSAQNKVNTAFWLMASKLSQYEHWSTEKRLWIQL